METVFNAPVFAAGIQQTRWGGACGFEAGDRINGFRGAFVADQVRGFAANRADLLGVREIDVSVEFRAGPDVADLQPSMGFIDCRVLRGEKTPISNRRYLDAGWADSL